MQRNTWHDLETFSERPLTSGTHQYAEVAEVMLWSFADGDGHVHVWDRVHGDLWRQDPVTEQWQNVPFEPSVDPAPTELQWILFDDDALVWFHNGGMFDMVVLQLTMPDFYSLIRFDRWRDTMVQALAHGCPGALEKLGAVLQLNQEDKKHTAEGRRLVRLFCVPQKDGTRATRDTHPEDWQKFIEYAGQDIITMREVHRKLPKWNYGGDSVVAERELRIWQADLKINYRGMAMDLDLARGAVRAVQQEKNRLASESDRVTLGNVPSATQRDVMLEYVLSEYGIALPDMQADTLERRLKDDTLPDAVRELIAIRLQASQNAASKYKTLLAAVSSDGRLRGTKQYCGALRTGRWAGRLMQMDNMPRPNIKAIAQWFGIPKSKVKSQHIKEFVDAGIAALKTGAEDLVFEDIMAVSGTVVRSTIVAPPGKRLEVADLSNIEGRFAAWFAGEEWKLQAFADYDTILGVDEDGELIRKGPDLYRKSYAKSFNIAISEVTKENRQVGKVQELMLQYGGGVGAFITGAATYELDLGELAEAAWPVLPPEVIAEAQNFLNWLYEGPERQAVEAIRKIDARFAQTLHEDPTLEKAALQVREHDTANALHRCDAAKLKARLGLPERTFLVCDSLKRLWRAAHPAISSYWKGNFDNPGIEDSVLNAIECPNTTFTARKLRFRRDGKWLRIVLPSGRALCYLDPKIENDGTITFMGLNQYTRQWGRVSTYGGKLFENVCQAAARDQLAEGLLLAEEHEYAPVLHVHDEIICEVEDNDLYSQQELTEMMCIRRKWNAGLPLAAAGFTTYRYRKE
jgi:DNA polymerase